MKLTEVDETLNEGFGSNLWAGLKATGLSAVGASQSAQGVLAKNNFINTFVEKMSNTLTSQWPQYLKKQQAAAVAQQQVQQQQAQKQKAMATTPAATQPALSLGAKSKTGVDVTDPNYAKYVAMLRAQGKLAESHRSINAKLTKLLTEQADPNIQALMSAYLTNVISQYMQGVDFDPAIIKQFADGIASTYESNHAIPTLKKLGEYLYNLTVAKQQEKKSQMPAANDQTAKAKTLVQQLQSLPPEQLQAVLAAIQSPKK
jgi:hypothetical protein